MISGAFLLPHSPILIPAIGKANTDLLRPTINAYQKLAGKTAAIAPDTILIISPHGENESEDFILSVAPEMKITLAEFGDLATGDQVAGDMILAYEMKEALGEDIKLRAQENLDYGAGIPLHLLSARYLNAKILTLNPGTKELSKQYEFGRKLGDFLINRPEKILVVASGELSHRLKRRSVVGYSPKGAKFDQKVKEYLNKAEGAAENILSLNTNLIDEAQACGLKAILIFLGSLSRLEYQPQILAYQDDLGVGYLSMDFNLNYGD